MSVEANATAGRAATWRVPPLVATISRSLRAVLDNHRLARELNGLSDHYLRDVGIDRPPVSRAMDEALIRDRLLEAGWRYSRRI